MQEALVVQVEDWVKKMIVEVGRLSIPADEIDIEEPLVGGKVDIDSLGFIELMLSVEENLNVEIPEDVWKQTHTVRDIARVLVEHVKRDDWNSILSQEAKT
ncbi:MAG: acyl carrier protein [Ammonifex sp.]|jgi:acyl carrier protein|nr:MAG: acyl carrier protein [Ammonifex sp.]